MPSLVTAEERARLQSETQGATRPRMLREMVEALDALVAETPLILFLEDLHWSDFSTLELIAMLAQRTDPARVLIIGAYRHVELLASDHPLRTMKEELELHQQCIELQLKLLSEASVADYLGIRFSDGETAQLFSGLAPAIHERTEGNPLFMVNVVDYLVAQGPPLDAIKIEAPRNIRQMIERNLERLSSEERSVLESASVAGAEFSAAALERPILEVETCCTDLSRREQFVTADGASQWPDGTVAASFGFRHALYRDVLYERVPAGQRAELHRRIAEREEQAYGERAKEIAAELAHHYSRTHDNDKAVTYFQLAGEQAVARGAMVEAEGHYRRALDGLGELPQEIARDRHELALQVAFGTALWGSKSWSHPEAGRAFARAQELAEKIEEFSQLVMVLGGLGASAVTGGEFKLGRELAERMLLAAEHSGNRGLLCAAHTFLADSLIWRAQFADAQRHLELGNTHYDETDRDWLASYGLVGPALAATAVLLLGFPDRARQLISEALRRSARHDDPLRTAIVHWWGGGLYRLLRDPQATLEHAQALRRLADKQPAWSGFSDGFTGEALLMQGDWEEGVRYVRRAIASHKAVGNLGMLPFTELDEAEFFASQGELDHAFTLVDAAIHDTEELSYLASPALRQRADLLAQSHAETSAIDAAYHAAIDCALSQGAKYYALQATTEFARWLKTQGRSAEGRTMLAGIYDWFTEGFDTVALKEAKALLDDLSTKPARSRRHLFVKEKIPSCFGQV
jgi:tetratricopeptide (TPR) repeat protein